MTLQCRDIIVERIRQSGPLTFAQFMELALYHPQTGYYSSAARRSGRSGDFYTSVDVGPAFGELLSARFAEMFAVLDATEGGRSESTLDLVEVGAGNGRLSRDVAAHLERLAPATYARLRLHLIEQSAPARGEQRATLGRHAVRLTTSSPEMPSPVAGVVFANELLDAMPTHVVAGRPEGLQEVYVDESAGSLVECEMPPSTPALAEYLERAGARLEPGWRAEVNLAAVEWIERAAACLAHGFLVLVDYGHEARVLYSPSHSQGTLATYTSHVVEVHEPGRPKPWLRDPGGCDITAHVDFTSVRAAAERAGLTMLWMGDQAHFLMARGVERYLQQSAGDDKAAIARRLALKTLLLPGGIGSTHHVLVFGRGVGQVPFPG